MHLDTIASRMLKGGVWIAGARAVTNGLGLVSTFWLARLLMPSDFGLVALGTSMLAIVSAMTALPISEALIQHREPTHDHFHTAFSLGVVRAAVIALVLALVATPLAWVYHEPRLQPVIWALAFSVLLSGFANPRRIMLNKQLIFWQDALLAIGQKFVLVAVSVGLAIYTRSYWALVLGAIASQFAGLVISYTSLPFLPRITFRHARELWSFSVWLSLGQIVNTINWRFDQLVLGALMGRSALGHYTVGDSLAQLPTREALAPLTQPLYPALSRVADDPARLRAAYQRAQETVTAIALPVGIGFALVASPIILGVMGEKWGPAVIVAQGLSSVFALQTLGSLVQPLGMAKGQTKLLFKRDVQMFFVRLPIIIAGIYFGGLKGLVTARIVTGLLAALVNMMLVRRLIDLPVRKQLRANLNSLVAVGLMACGVLALRAHLPPMKGYIELVGGIGLIVIVASIVYVGAMALLWMMAGRPSGVERDVATMLGRIIQRISSRKDRLGEGC